MRRSFLLTVLLMALGAAEASAQLPIQFSVNGGLVIPIGGEKDIYENGFHAGAGLKLPAIPLQLEAGYDQMPAAGTNDDLSIVSGGVSLAIPLTPPLLPAGVYLIGGAGIYHTKAETSVTDFGINGGVGVRAGIPGIRLFGEGRGVAILADANKLSYLTVSLGIRF